LSKVMNGCPDICAKPNLALSRNDILYFIIHLVFELVIKLENKDMAKIILRA
jgi:hypothetical protein